MNNHITINGQLYEAVKDPNDTYLPKRDDIIEGIDDAIDDLKEVFRESLTLSAKNDKNLKKLFSDATIALTDLRDYLRKNYTTIYRLE